MPTRKTIDVPCMVKNRLNTSGSSNVLTGTTSCKRIATAISPATTKKPRAVPMYIRPSFLWSTVITRSCNRSTNEEPNAPSAGIAIFSVAIPPSLFERLQVSSDLVHLLISQLHIGHQTAQRELLRIAQPEAQVIRRICYCTRTQCFAIHQVSEIRTELPLC